MLYDGPHNHAIWENLNEKEKEIVDLLLSKVV